MEYNKELQFIDNHNKAYLLGLFYADGNVGKNSSDTKLYLKDKELILKLKEEFNFFNVYEQNNLLGIHKCVKSLKEDFILHGCLPDKSNANKDNIKIPFNNSFTSSFIRGYFDGDGGCSLTLSTKIQKRVYIYSASINFLKEIKEVLLSNSIETAIIKNRNIFMLMIRTKSYRNFYNYIYQNSEIYLERKKNKMEELLLTTIFIQKEAPICKFCNSNNTVFNGNYSYKGILKPRTLCKDCKRNFTTTAPLVSND